jgi:hypothetical protein
MSAIFSPRFAMLQLHNNSSSNIPESSYTYLFNSVICLIATILNDLAHIGNKRVERL